MPGNNSTTPADINTTTTTRTSRAIEFTPVVALETRTATAVLRMTKTSSSRSTSSSSFPFQRSVAGNASFTSIAKRGLDIFSRAFSSGSTDSTTPRRTATSGVSTIRSLDVVYDQGRTYRGRTYWNHHGNQVYHKLMDVAKMRYSKGTTNRLAKSLIVTEIIDAIQERGRFIKLVGRGKNSIVEICEEAFIREKVKQSLRDTLSFKIIGRKRRRDYDTNVDDYDNINANILYDEDEDDDDNDRHGHTGGDDDGDNCKNGMSSSLESHLKKKKRPNSCDDNNNISDIDIDNDNDYTCDIIKQEVETEECNGNMIDNKNDNKVDDGRCIIHPRKMDILGGRGGAVLNHPGNISYRRLISLNKELYTACLRQEKMKLSQSIVAAIQEKNGRFLERNAKLGVWCDIGNKKAIEKTSQALREGQSKLHKQMVEKEQIRPDRSCNQRQQQKYKQNKQQQQQLSMVLNEVSTATVAAVLATTIETNSLINPRKTDIMCGRGSAAKSNPGNITYHNVVNSMKGLYATCLKNEKTKISRSIVATIREKKGLFLEINTKLGVWCDIGNKKAIEKTSQALREGQPKRRKQMVEMEQIPSDQLIGKNDNDDGNNIISYVDNINNDVCDIIKQGEIKEEWNDNMKDSINKKSQRNVVLLTSTLSQKQKPPSSSSSLSSSTSSTKTKASISTTIASESACQEPLLAISPEQHSICRRRVDSLSSASRTKMRTEMIVFNKEDKEQGDYGAKKVVRSSSSSSSLSSINKKILTDNDNTDKPVNTMDRVKFPTECDILCSQSRICASHVGNKRFQAVLDIYAARYDNATRKQEKMMTTKEIVACIHNSSGRFLQFKKEHGMWEEISNTAAREKVSHALRTKVKHNQKKNGPNNTTPRGGGREKQDEKNHYIQHQQPKPKKQLQPQPKHQQERNQKQQHHSNQKNHWQLKKN